MRLAPTARSEMLCGLIQLGAALQATSVAALVGRPAAPLVGRMSARHAVKGAVHWGKVRWAEGQASRGEGGSCNVEVVRDGEGRALLDRGSRRVRKGQGGGVGVAVGQLQGEAGSYGQGPVDGDGHLQPQVQHNLGAACAPHPKLSCAVSPPAPVHNHAASGRDTPAVTRVQLPILRGAGERRNSTIRLQGHAADAVRHCAQHDARADLTEPQ